MRKERGLRPSSGSARERCAHKDILRGIPSPQTPPANITGFLNMLVARARGVAASGKA